MHPALTLDEVKTRRVCLSFRRLGAQVRGVGWQTLHCHSAAPQAPQHRPER